MNLYQCENCGKTAKSETTTISNAPKCTIGTHNWKILGIVGPNKWTCQNCNKTVMTIDTPSSNNGKCIINGNIKKPHTWRLIGNRVNIEKKQPIYKQERILKKESNNFKFTISGVIWWVIKLPFKLLFNLFKSSINTSRD